MYMKTETRNVPAAFVVLYFTTCADVYTDMACRNRLEQKMSCEKCAVTHTSKFMTSVGGGPTPQ